jgi:hypothetical protein
MLEGIGDVWIGLLKAVKVGTDSRLDALETASQASASPKHLTRAETAACLLAMLGRQGVTFRIDAHGYLRSDLNALPLPQRNCSPDDLAHIILQLAEPIKAIIRAHRTLH